MGRRQSLLLLLVLYGILVTLRLSAPYDIDTSDQAKQGLYVVDVVQKNSFFLPTCRGDLATKPPLYNWVAACFSFMFGGVTDISIKLPAVLCGFGVVVVTFLLGGMLFTRKVGLFAGLVLILNVHFIKLACTARTDMMLCLFVSLALYFFLLAYYGNGKASVYNILAFVAMGLGSITKGPIGLLIPALVILVFLFSKKDMKALASMKIGSGLLIWLLMMLAWFIPALIEGGREFFDIVVYDEAINRFFALGTRTSKVQPFYYLVTHFLAKFLPWSLFVPSAIVRHFKSGNETEKSRLLFPLVWFFTVLIFFSLSKGKRADYLLPLYPAASVIAAHFWLSVIAEGKAGRWKAHLRVPSLCYLSASLLAAACLTMVSFVPAFAEAVVRIAPDSSDEAALLCNAVSERIGLFLLTAVPLAAVSILGVILAARINLRALSIAMFAAAGLYVSLYFEVLSPETKKLDGERKRAFCEEAARVMSSTENLKFCRVHNSIPLYMGKNERALTHDEAIEFFRVTDSPYVIITEAGYHAMRELSALKLTRFARNFHRGSAPLAAASGSLSPHEGKQILSPIPPDSHRNTNSYAFEFVPLVESERLVENKTKYVLLGKKGKSASRSR